MRAIEASAPLLASIITVTTVGALVTLRAPVTVLALAALVAGRGDRAAAKALLDRAAQLSPKDPAVHCVRGQLELSSGQGAQAAASFAAALAANPRYEQAELGLGRAQTMAGQRAEGERAIRSASSRLAPGAVEEFDVMVDAWRKAAASQAAPVVPACVAVPVPAPSRSATSSSTRRWARGQTTSSGSRSTGS